MGTTECVNENVSLPLTHSATRKMFFLTWSWNSLVVCITCELTSERARWHYDQNLISGKVYSFDWPSNVGFTDPAQGASLSFGNITIALSTTNPTIDNLVLSNFLKTLQSEIGEEFLKVQKEIEYQDAIRESEEQAAEAKEKAGEQDSTIGLG